MEIDGAPCEAQLVIGPLGPLKIQVGVPDGATEPTTPVALPVKVMIWPLTVED